MNELLNARMDKIWELDPILDVVLANCAPFLRQKFTDLSHGTWTDLVKPVCKKAAELSLTGNELLSDEGQYLWEQIDSATKIELQNFVTQAERKNYEASAHRQKLHKIAKAIFTKENEKDIVVPLCCLMHYVKDQNRSYLDLQPGDGV